MSARRFIGPAVLSGSAAAFLALAGSCVEEDSDAARQGPRPNVLLISIDTLRADHLGCYGYAPYAEPVSPAIDSLAREGARFEQCFAPRGQTKPSLASLMTGKYPSAHGIRENGQKYVGPHPTMAEVLGRFGYETRAFVSVPWGLIGDQPNGPGRGFDELQIAQTAFQRSRGKSDLDDKHEWDEWVRQRGIEAIESHEEGDAPFFLWLHTYSVHRPYAAPAGHDRRFVGDYDGTLLLPEGASVGDRGRKLDMFLMEKTLAGESIDEEDRAFVVSQYDAAVRFNDELVGDVLEALDRQGLAEDTLVIFTADHGEELGEHNGYWFHGNSIYDSTLRIPLVMRWPGHIEPGVVNGLSQNLDLLPTLTELLKEASPPDLEGVSLASVLREKGDRATGREAVFVEWQDLIWAVRTDEWKYVSNPDHAHPKKPPYYNETLLGPNEGFAIADEELYEIACDPREQVNRIGEASTPLEALRRLVGVHRDRPAAIKSWHLVDAETRARLEALGYTSTQEGRPDVHFREN